MPRFFKGNFSSMLEKNRAQIRQGVFDSVGDKMRKKVILACVECGSRNYTTMKNNSSAERLEMKKFCKTCNSHTNHRETK
jgi:large subunit ribosomal protein L33